MSTDPKDKIVIEIDRGEQKDLREKVDKHGEMLTEVKTIVERIDHELLGNGQPGKISLIEGRLGKLENSESHLKGWVLGVGGVFLCVGALAEFIYHISSLAKH